MATTLVQPSSEEPQEGRRKAGGSLFAAAIVCLLASWVVRTSSNLDQIGASFRPSESATSHITGGDWLTGMLLGFREAVADMMWIQVDQYFHEGRYDKIMPLCYMITAMDPGWVDVYTTGAWHMGYNFGDRRLVPAAIDFDRRGAENNPKNYDMRYEVGWMEMTRGYDFADAARDFALANALKL